MKSAEAYWDFIADPSSQPILWRKPASISTGVHALLVPLLLWMFQWQSIPRQESFKVLEINVIGQEDIKVRGTADDFMRGPLPGSTALANPVKNSPDVVSGNTEKLSAGLPETPKPKLPVKLAPTGPLFGAHVSASAASGVGREKIHVPESQAVKLSRAVQRDKVPTGEGLVGVPGPAIDLKSKRGGGPGSSGSGEFLSSGKGAVGGAEFLQKKGESILAEYSEPSAAMVKGEKQSLNMPAAPEGFFSIRGPLSQREIKKLNLPSYPRWAEEQGIEALVSVRLTVAADGVVNPGLILEQTSGFPDLDRIVLEAIKNIKFSALPRDKFAPEQWGVASFNFKLKKFKRRGAP